MLDPETLRAAAKLARLRADSAQRDPRIEGDQRDGMERLGAYRALHQLSVDLEITARHAEEGEPDDGAPSDAKHMQDHEPVEAYEVTDGDPKDLEVSRMVEEIEKRGLDV